MGTPEMKATSLLFDFTRTPICHSLWYPGGVNALRKLILTQEKLSDAIHGSPLEKLRCVLEPEGGTVVFHIIKRQKVIDFLNLGDHQHSVVRIKVFLPT